MDVHYIADEQGKPIAIVIPIEDWHGITAKHQDLKSLEMPKKKPSDFRGVISEKTTDDMLRYIEQARTEWEILPFRCQHIN